MMAVDCETASYAVLYGRRYRIGYVTRKSDGRTTTLLADSDMTALRRTLNRVRTNSTSTRKRHRPAEKIADAILGE